ncbi:MAG: protein translocase subunit SecD [Anaerolineae bacterium]|nr:protein translocase subunit SecD [Anaerolineae bacterium]
MPYFRFWLVIIFLVVIISAWMVYPENPGLHIAALGLERDIEVQQGLDLQGGSRVLLEAAFTEEDVSSDELSATRQIVERRVNGLGVAEAVVQTQGSNRILVELPGVSDRDLALSTIQGTGLLEFVNFSALGTLMPGEGDCILTTAQLEQFGANPTCPPTEPGGERRLANTRPDGTSYQTVMTGSGLDDAIAEPAGTGIGNAWIVSFTLTSEGDTVFADYTGSNIGQPMAIVLDGEVISAPTINARISGSGIIEGGFSRAEAEALAIQLRYGALPVPLEVAAFDTVGPTLGRISVERSVEAGIIGIITVLVFMVTYYRAPGLAAALALIIFAMINFAAYKFIPVTLTLPAITGFLISIGTAVDGNILIFERLKEELRAGRDLRVAIRLGFERAWTSIRDSNLSTIIICVILWSFGSSFGASAVQGFALTLGMGLLFNLFTAVVVTQAFLALIVRAGESTLKQNRWLLGV